MTKIDNKVYTQVRVKMVKKNVCIMFILVCLIGLNAYAASVFPGEYIGGDAAFVPHAAWQPGGTFIADSSDGLTGWGTRAPRRTVNGHDMSPGGTHGLIGNAQDSGWLGAMNNNGGNGGNPAGQTGDAWISYQFDDVYELGLMHVWNWNSSGNPGGGEFVGGISGVIIDYSVDGNTWTTLGQFQFPQAPDTAGYAGEVGPDFAGASAKFVVITIDPNDWNHWSGETSTLHGLGEVAFDIALSATVNLTVNVQSPTGAIPTNLDPPAGVNEVFVGIPVSLSAPRFAPCPEVLEFDQWTGVGIADPLSQDTTITLTEDQTITVVYKDDRQCDDECHEVVAQDFDSSCVVDLLDFGAFAGVWMNCNTPACDGF